MDSAPKSVVVVGLGDDILSDDSVGLVVARALQRRLRGWDVDVVESEVAGLPLLELIVGYQRAVIIDAIDFPDTEPGRVFRVDHRDLHASLCFGSVHELDVAALLELGGRLEVPVPSSVVIFAVQVGPARSLTELSMRVHAAVPRLVAMVIEEIGCSRVAHPRLV